MKKLIAFAALALLSTVLLVLPGCDSDEEDPNTATGPCGISLTRPLPGEVFLSGDEVKIQWDRSGTDPTVAIELLKAGDYIGTISLNEENDGWYFWDAEFFQVGTDTSIADIDTTVSPADTTYSYSPRYMPNSDDYMVRVRATGQNNCQDVSPEFSLTNVSGCNYDFITPPEYDSEDPLVLDADDGSTYDITWFSSSTTGLVDLILLSDQQIVGYIETDVPDSLHSYTWEIDSLHEGSGNRYQVRIQDTKVESCKQDSDRFHIVDENICSIELLAPTETDELTIGQTYVIRWNYEQVDGNLDITLTYGGKLLDVIATDVDPTDLYYEWEVWAPTPLPEENTSLYRVTITDNANLYAPCSGLSDAFLITE